MNDTNANLKSLLCPILEANRWPAWSRGSVFHDKSDMESALDLDAIRSIKFVSYHYHVVNPRVEWHVAHRDGSFHVLSSVAFSLLVPITHPQNGH